MNKVTKIAISLGVITVLTGGAVYLLKRKKGVTYSKFSKLSVYTKPVSSKMSTGTAKDVITYCSNTSDCTGFVCKGKDELDCTAITSDPYTEWVDNDDADLFIRQNSSDPLSQWSDWDASLCPVCGSTSSDLQTRVCTGKCPGSPTKLCPETLPCPDKFERVMGYYPDVSYFQDDNNFQRFEDMDPKEAESQMSQMVTQNGWFGYMWDGNHRMIALKVPFQDVYGVNPLVPDTFYMWIRQPSGYSPFSNPLPPQSDNTTDGCACGKVLVRECIVNGKQGNCYGPSKFHCHPILCAYSKFNHMSVI